MASGKLRAVTIGAGWAGEGHSKALQHYGVEVIAICARKSEIVQAVASRLGIPQASTDWRRSLLEIRPDIVAIGTPGILRSEVIELAVELGCHLFCDKPLATTAKEAGRLYELVRQAGIKHAYAATHRYDPSVAWMYRLLDKGTIGTLWEVDRAFGRWFGGAGGRPRETVKPWSWMDSLQHGGGVLNNGLPHMLGMLERMTGGKILSVIGEASVLRRRAPVVPDIHDFRQWIRTGIPMDEAKALEWRECDADNRFTAMFQLSTPFSENPIRVSMHPASGVPNHVPPDGWYFYGEQGVLLGKGGHILAPITRHAADEVEELAVPQELVDRLPKVGDDIQNKWAALARDFVADIEGRPHEPYLTFHDGWRYQIAIEAIRESKGWTWLPE